MRDASIDLIIADPPYGQTSLSWDKRIPNWPAAVRRLLKPSGSMWVFGSTRLFMETAASFRLYKLSHDVVWEKQNGAGFFNDRFRTVHEIVAHFYPTTSKWRDIYKQPQFSNDATAKTVRRKQTPAHWTGERNPTHFVSEDGGPRLLRSVLYARNEHNNAEHPTQKPVDILDLLIRYSCPPNGIVLDPFCGSGSTGVACALEGRHFIGIEKDPKYFAIAQRRLAHPHPSC